MYCDGQVFYGSDVIIMFGWKFFENSVRKDTLNLSGRTTKIALSKRISTNYLVPKKEG